MSAEVHSEQSSDHTEPVLRPGRDDKSFQDFFDSASIPFHMVSPDGVICEVNQAELDLLGYRREEYVGRPLAEFHMHPEVVEDILQRLARGERLAEYEAQLRCKDGTVKDVLVDASGLWRDGRLEYSRCLMRDVTGRDETGEAASRLAAIVDSSDDAIVSKDLDGIVRSWNAGAERLFGYSAAEIVGRSIRTIIPADHQGEEDEVLRRIRRGERVNHFETVRQRKDGRLVPISLTISPVRDRSGRIVGASKIARDITEQRAAHESLRQSMALKDQFLSLVSHELRTPIATIVGNSQLLLRREGRITETGRAQALTDVLAEAERLERIVENLLVLTRLEATLGHSWTTVDMAAVTTSVVQGLRLQIARPITLMIEKGLQPVTGDDVLITLILQNLLTNAAKYSPAGEPIDVALRPVDGTHAELAVLDRGIGVSDEDTERIFESFYRGEEARTHAVGMGLGLAVCRKAVEVLGGSIGVAPRPGGGSVFSTLLPFATGQVA